MLTRLLFETPWWLPTVAIGVGIFVWITGNRRQESQVMRGGLAIVLAGLLIMLISVMVDTDREKAVKRTRGIVASANDHDWAKFKSLLDPQTSIYGLKGPDEITAAAKSAAEQINLTSARITGLQAEQTSSVITVDIRMISDQFRGNPAPTDWRFTYQNFGQGFALYSVNALNNEIINEQMIRARINRYLPQ